MKNKNGKVDNYTYIIISIVLIILGILMLAKVLPADFTSGVLANKPEISGVIFIIIGIVGLGIGIKNEVKRLANKKSSYYVIKKMTDYEIKNRLAVLEEDINIERSKNHMSIFFNHKDGIFELVIQEDFFTIGFDYLDENTYDSLSEQEQKRIDDMFYEGNPLLSDEREILNKFIEYVNVYKNSI